MRIAGAIFIVLGLLLCLSIFGAVIGIPLILIGIVMVIVGGRRKTIITNVVQVSNNGPAPQLAVAHGDGEWRRDPPPVRPKAREPSIRAQPVAALPPGNADFDLDYESDFVDARSELSDSSRRVLAMAKEDGYEFRARPDRIVVKKGDHEEVLRSNQAVEEFGRAMRYL